MAGCGYVCPVCEGRTFLENGSPCHWCRPHEVAPSAVIQRPVTIKAVEAEPTIPPDHDPGNVREADHLIRLANTKMPFGKYAGQYLVNLPETYLLWFKQAGFPEGNLGRLMAEICEIQANGLEPLLRPLIRD